jgi:hypothetical protein
MTSPQTNGNGNRGNGGGKRTGARWPDLLIGLLVLLLLGGFGVLLLGQRSPTVANTATTPPSTAPVPPATTPADNTEIPAAPGTAATAPPELEPTPVVPAPAAASPEPQAATPTPAPTPAAAPEQPGASTAAVTPTRPRLRQQLLPRLRLRQRAPHQPHPPNPPRRSTTFLPLWPRLWNPFLQSSPPRQQRRLPAPRQPARAERSPPVKRARRCALITASASAPFRQNRRLVAAQRASAVWATASIPSMSALEWWRRLAHLPMKPLHVRLWPMFSGPTRTPSCTRPATAASRGARSVATTQLLPAAQHPAKQPLRVLLLPRPHRSLKLLRQHPLARSICKLAHLTGSRVLRTWSERCVSKVLLPL